MAVGAVALCAGLAAAAVAVLLTPGDTRRLRDVVGRGGRDRAGGRAGAGGAGPRRFALDVDGSPSRTSVTGNRTADSAATGSAAVGSGAVRSLVLGSSVRRGTTDLADAEREGGPVRAASSAVLACVLAGAAVALLVSGPVGLAVGAAVALAGPRLLARLEPRQAREQRDQLLGDLPLTLDLLAACLSGGAALPAAADAVGQAVGGPAGERLLAVSAALAVGSPPGEAWRQLAGPGRDDRAEDPFGPAARALGRAADGGAPVATAVARLAVEVRAEARGRAEQAARRVGVLAVAPLGLCFLPAFVLLGIVPMVVSLAAPLFATL